MAGIPDENPGFDLDAIDFGLIVAWFLVMCTMTFSVQSVAQISYAAEDSSAARRGFMLVSCLCLWQKKDKSPELILRAGRLQISEGIFHCDFDFPGVSGI